MHAIHHTDWTSLRRQIPNWPQWWPSLRGGLWALALFALGLWLVRRHAGLIQGTLDDWQALGLLGYFGSSVLAVLVPALSNLPLLPLAVTAWGKLPAAALLLAGWTVGSVLAFVLARLARGPVERHMPAVMRLADIDRLIHPRHRLWSLIMLRMSFPVDVLSHALGLFSQRTTWVEVALSTAIGGAPFAALFAFVPTLPPGWQALTLGLSVGGFAVYALWILRAGPAAVARDTAGP